jgi:hypothetical protein
VNQATADFVVDELPGPSGELSELFVDGLKTARAQQ